ncbi:fimbrial assembly protein [Pengzhenrongella sicca]|uniref:Fimbrial assembly protein n=2 Tax=Pengzhenrongella sicca TaxID=2819238 RepID=A0A8A4ZPF6_9MICO|nr:fimbrial assembly protein [Pengzhenrongella sicca]
MAPAYPQVNLLPPEIRAARTLRGVKRNLAISLVLVLAVCATGFGLSAMTASTAAAELATARDDTARLTAEQQTYAEVPQVLSSLGTAKAARQLAMSTEVLWKGYLDAITAVLPTDVRIESYQVTGATAMEAAPVPADPLQGQSVGQITFTGSTPSQPDTAAWLDALDSIPGFADAWFTGATLTASESGESSYAVSVTVQFTDAALANRFTAEGAS